MLVLAGPAHNDCDSLTPSEKIANIHDDSGSSGRVRILDGD